MNPADDENIKQDIFDQLTWDDSIDASDINVSVLNGVASLEGTVPSYSAKMAAEGYAYDTSEITDVENNLIVDFPTAEPMPSDLEITTSIENKFEWHSKINAAGIRVETINGNVTLSGVVESYWEKVLAENLALDTYGVADIANELTVVPVKSFVDDGIENDIRSAYRRSGLIDEKKITVEVNGGIVRLRGIAANNLVKSRAYDIAVYTAGVKDIIDEITVV